jgi:MFS family permease
MSPDRRLSRARLGILSTFALAGALCAVWTVRMPALKQKLDLTDAQLGLEVLGWGVGALITMTIASRIIRRYGSRRVLRLALPATAFCLALVGLAPSYPLLIAAGLAFGLCFGLVDVAMNTQASTVERAYGRPLMGGMHAGWSFGAVAGGLLGAITAWLGFGFTGALCMFAVIGLPLTLLLGPLYLSEERASRAESALSARTRRLPLLVYLFGAIVFCSYLTEGAIADWSGVYLHDSLGSVQTVAALGYPMFEASMFLGRICSDRLTTRFGARTLILAAGTAAAAAFTLVVFAPTPMFALAGFALVGLGVCAVTPLAMSLAGTSGGAQTERAIATASTFGYTGLLLGPVVIGFVSAATSMRIGYALVIGVCVTIALSANFIPRGRHIEDRGRDGDALDRSGDPGVRREVTV